VHRVQENSKVVGEFRPNFFDCTDILSSLEQTLESHVRLYCLTDDKIRNGNPSREREDCKGLDCNDSHRGSQWVHCWNCSTTVEGLHSNECLSSCFQIFTGK